MSACVCRRVRETDRDGEQIIFVKFNKNTRVKIHLLGRKSLNKRNKKKKKKKKFWSTFTGDIQEAASQRLNTKMEQCTCTHSQGASRGKWWICLLLQLNLRAGWDSRKLNIRYEHNNTTKLLDFWVVRFGFVPSLLFGGRQCNSFSISHRSLKVPHQGGGDKLVRGTPAHKTRNFSDAVNWFIFVHFLVAPCCSQGATLQVTLRCRPVVCPASKAWTAPQASAAPADFTQKGGDWGLRPRQPPKNPIWQAGCSGLRPS